jgi:hypothetical protein
VHNAKHAAAPRQCLLYASNDSALVHCDGRQHNLIASLTLLIPRIYSHSRNRHVQRRMKTCCLLMHRQYCSRCQCHASVQSASSGSPATSWPSVGDMTPATSVIGVGRGGAARDVAYLACARCRASSPPCHSRDARRVMVLWVRLRALCHHARYPLHHHHAQHKHRLPPSCLLRLTSMLGGCGIASLALCSMIK